MYNIICLSKNYIELLKHINALAFAIAIQFNVKTKPNIADVLFYYQLTSKKNRMENQSYKFYLANGLEKAE